MKRKKYIGFSSVEKMLVIFFLTILQFVKADNYFTVERAAYTTINDKNDKILQPLNDTFNKICAGTQYFLASDDTNGLSCYSSGQTSNVWKQRNKDCIPFPLKENESSVSLGSIVVEDIQIWDYKKLRRFERPEIDNYIQIIATNGGTIQFKEIKKWRGLLININYNEGKKQKRCAFAKVSGTRTHPLPNKLDDILNPKQKLPDATATKPASTTTVTTPIINTILTTLTTTTTSTTSTKSAKIITPKTTTISTTPQTTTPTTTTTSTTPATTTTTTTTRTTARTTVPSTTTLRSTNTTSVTSSEATNPIKVITKQNNNMKIKVEQDKDYRGTNIILLIVIIGLALIIVILVIVILYCSCKYWKMGCCKGGKGKDKKIKNGESDGLLDREQSVAVPMYPIPNGNTKGGGSNDYEPVSNHIPQNKKNQPAEYTPVQNYEPAQKYDPTKRQDGKAVYQNISTTPEYEPVKKYDANENKQNSTPVYEAYDTPISHEKDAPKIPITEQYAVVDKSRKY